MSKKRRRRRTRPQGSGNGRAAAPVEAPPEPNPDPMGSKAPEATEERRPRVGLFGTRGRVDAGPYPPMGVSLARGLRAVAGSPVVLAVAFLSELAVWGLFAGLGPAPPPPIMVMIMALPPVSVYFDAQLVAVVARETLPAFGLAVGLMALRATTFGLLGLLVLSAVRTGKPDLGDALRRLPKTALTLALIFALELAIVLAVPSLLAQFALLGVLAVLVLGLIFLGMAPVIAVAEGVRAQDALRRGFRASRLPGGRHVLLLMAYFFFTDPDDHHLGVRARCRHRARRHARRAHVSLAGRARPGAPGPGATQGPPLALLHCERGRNGRRHTPGDAPSGPARAGTGRGGSGRRRNRKEAPLSVTTRRQLLEAGVHFGHQTRRWNPKMGRYIYGERGGIYIVDLEKTLSGLEEAYAFVRDLAREGKTILFVGTKKQAQDVVSEQARRVGMPYVNTRWLGGMLTNFQTIFRRLQRLLELREMERSGALELLSKKEVLKLRREKEKLERNLSGIQEMEGLPGAVFVVDTKKEHIAVTEARKLGVPVIAIVDTNCDPDEVDFVIPGNDDAIRAITLVTTVIADAVEEGRRLAGHDMVQRVQAAGPFEPDAGRPAEAELTPEEAAWSAGAPAEPAGPEIEPEPAPAAAPPPDAAAEQPAATEPSDAPEETRTGPAEAGAPAER